MNLCLESRNSSCSPYAASFTNDWRTRILDRDSRNTHRRHHIAKTTAYISKSETIPHAKYFDISSPRKPVDNRRRRCDGNAQMQAVRNSFGRMEGVAAWPPWPKALLNVQDRPVKQAVAFEDASVSLSLRRQPRGPSGQYIDVDMSDGSQPLPLGSRITLLLPAEPSTIKRK